MHLRPIELFFEFERLLKLVVINDSSGKALYDLLKQNFEKYRISK